MLPGCAAPASPTAWTRRCLRAYGKRAAGRHRGPTAARAVAYARRGLPPVSDRLNPPADSAEEGTRDDALDSGGHLAPTVLILKRLLTLLMSITRERMRPAASRHRLGLSGGRRRPPQTWLLTMMALVAALRGALAVADPLSPRGSTGAYLVIALLAAGLALLVWWAPWRWCLHLALLSGVGAVAFVVAVAANVTGAAASSIGYVWIALYAAFFFSRRVTRAYVVACLGSYAVALSFNAFPGAVSVSVPLSLTVIAVAEVTNRVVRALQHAATTDPLTGLLNRQGLEAAATSLLAQAQRSRCAVSVVIVDLNGFKLVNDTHGHAAGDGVLADLARGWQPVLRAADIVARYGGDEFVLVLPDTDRPAALLLLRRLHAHSSVDWSFGLAVASGDHGLQELLTEADADLYHAKRNRNRHEAKRRPDAEHVLGVQTPTTVR